MLTTSSGLTSAIEGDGAVASLYELLWKRKTGTIGLDTDVRIAPTVVYENNFPKVWFVHNERNDNLERRIGSDVTPEAIVHDFTKKPPLKSRGRRHIPDDSGEVVATYFCSIFTEEGEPATRVEFLNRESLNEMVYHRCRRPDGFLQRWIPSQGKYNTVVQAVWTPHHCHVEKRQNIRGLRDKRFPTYDRAVTYEGPSHLSKEAFVAPHIRWQIRIFCQDVVDHIMNVEKIQIQGMVLHFKVDPQCTIWFLWCSSLRLTHSPLNLAPRYVRNTADEELENKREAERIEMLLRFRNIHGTVNVGGVHAMKPRPPPDAIIRKPIPPPSLGPIGDCYTSCPAWSVRNRAKLEKQVQQHYWAGVPMTVARRLAVKAEIDKRAKQLEGTRMTSAVSFRKRGSTTLSQFSRSIVRNPLGINEDAHVPKPRQDTWACVRVALRSGYFHVAYANKVVSEWLAELLEVTAAYVGWSEQPLVIAIPPIVTETIGLEWVPAVFEAELVHDEVLQDDGEGVPGGDDTQKRTTWSITGLRVASMMHAHTYLVSQVNEVCVTKLRTARFYYVINRWVMRRKMQTKSVLPDGDDDNETVISTEDGDDGDKDDDEGIDKSGVVIGSLSMHMSTLRKKSTGPNNNNSIINNNSFSSRAAAAATTQAPAELSLLKSMSRSPLLNSSRMPQAFPAAPSTPPPQPL
eukprot:PhM_4_TR16640/c0_g1_i1/m.12868